MPKPNTNAARFVVHTGRQPHHPHVDERSRVRDSTQTQVGER